MLPHPLATLLLPLLTLPLTALSATIQAPGLTQTPLSLRRANEIRTAYRASYSAYLRYATGHDALLPLTNSYTDPFGGWGASVVDSLSTSFIMNHIDLYESGVEYAKKIDFSKTKSAAFRCSRRTFGISPGSSLRTS